jgi:hypothetical protein
MQCRQLLANGARMNYTGKRHGKSLLKRQIANTLDERNHGRIQGCGCNNLIEATNPCGKSE